MHLLSTALLAEGSIIDLDGTIFIQFGLFALAFIALRPLVFKPMVRLFEARDEAIRGSKLEARRLQEEADTAGDTFEEQMRNIRLQAAAERDRLRAEGKRLEKAVLDHARQETKKQLEDASANIRHEAASIRAGIEQDVPNMARAIASKLLQREVN